MATRIRRVRLGGEAVDRAHLHVEAVGDQADDAIERRTQIARFADQCADRLEQQAGRGRALAPAHRPERERAASVSARSIVYREADAGYNPATWREQRASCASCSTFGVRSARPGPVTTAGQRLRCTAAPRPRPADPHTRARAGCGFDARENGHAQVATLAALTHLHRIQSAPPPRVAAMIVAHAIDEGLGAPAEDLERVLGGILLRGRLSLTLPPAASRRLRSG